MNAAKQAAWAFIALFSLAVFAWYSASSDTKKRLDDETLSNTADAIITSLVVYQFDENGKVANYLSTPLLHHIPKNNVHILQTPHIKVAQKNETPWEIDALIAKSMNGGEKIILSQDVKMVQNKEKSNAKSELRTDEIIYYPKFKFAKSDKKVKFTQPGNVIESNGIEAYLDKKQVKLLSRARGVYEPEKTKG